MQCPGCGVSVLVAFEPPEAVGMYLAEAETNARHTSAACAANRNDRAARIERAAILALRILTNSQPGPSHTGAGDCGCRVCMAAEAIRVALEAT